MCAKAISSAKLGKKAPFPSGISPMLCTLIREPYQGAGYIHEIKLDGYRIVGFKQKNKVRLDSRSGLNYTSKYPPIEKALQQLKHDCVVDGEIVVHNAEGLPDFDALQANKAGSALHYYVFDLLWLDGYDLRALPLTERKAQLRKILKGSKLLKYSEDFPDGEALFEEVKKNGIEGIVSKDAQSPYIEGDRSRAWLKTPTEIRQEFVIGGWIESDTNPYFKTLLFGAYKGDELEWIGHSGSGYKNKEMPAILKKLQALESKENPFSNKVDSKGRIHWVKPKLVANFKFATWTRSGRIRKPATFLGWRADKKATDVTREVPKELKKEKPEQASTKKEKRKIITAADSNWKKVEAQVFEQEEVLDLGDCSVTVQDVHREIWPGVTKASLISYYHSVAEFILPHLKDRPLSLHVKPINAEAPGFYIKDMEGREPECADLFSTERKHKKQGKRNVIDYLVCNNVATLLYQVNLGCIDINPWTARTITPKTPDHIVVDLDPSDNDFSKAIKSAIATKQVLNTHKLKAFVKTSGKTGIHILIPCRGFSFPECRRLAEILCKEVNKLLPRITTTIVSISERGNKLYLDPNQNDEADTIASAYSVRPGKKPMVSTPLEWKEVNDKLNPAKFTMDTILKRLKLKGDLWADILDEGIALKNNKLLERLQGF